MTDEHPIKQIEDASFWTDIGKQGALIFAGALEESGNLATATDVTAAFYQGLWSSVKKPED
jgi:hypothetical protein